MTGSENMRQQTANGGRSNNHRTLRPGIQEFLANLESHPELGWLSSHVFKLSISAFVAKDCLFPKPGCTTLLGAGPFPQVELPDQFVSSVLTLARNGPADPEHTEMFGILGLLEFAGRGPNDASRIVSHARQLLWLESNSQLAILTFATTLMTPSEITILARAIFNLLDESNVPETDPPRLGARSTLQSRGCNRSTHLFSDPSKNWFVGSSSLQFLGLAINTRARNGQLGRTVHYQP